MAGPAAEVTRERPCVALAEYSDAVLWALAAVSFAAAEAFVVVVDWSLRADMRPAATTDLLVASESIFYVLVGRGNWSGDNSLS